MVDIDSSSCVVVVVVVVVVVEEEVVVVSKGRLLFVVFEVEMPVAAHLFEVDLVFFLEAAVAVVDFVVLAA